MVIIIIFFHLSPEQFVVGQHPCVHPRQPRRQQRHWLKFINPKCFCPGLHLCGGVNRFKKQGCCGRLRKAGSRRPDEVRSRCSVCHRAQTSSRSLLGFSGVRSCDFYYREARWLLVSRWVLPCPAHPILQLPLPALSLPQGRSWRFAAGGEPVCNGAHAVTTCLYRTNNNCVARKI